MCNNGGANSVAVSEHAMLLMLSVSRRLITQHANVTAGRWHGNAPPTVHEVRNKVLGIIGLGTIGKKVARLAQAFGMLVHYYDIARLKEEQEDALGVRFRLLPEILRALRHRVAARAAERLDAPHDRGRQELAAMKKSAIIVNTSRGPVIDEKAMTEALSDEQAVRRRPRRVRRGADAARQPAAQARQRGPDRASRRPDLGEQHHPPAQRLRQRAARRPRRGPAVGRREMQGKVDEEQTLPVHTGRCQRLMLTEWHSPIEAVDSTPPARDEHLTRGARCGGHPALNGRD